MLGTWNATLCSPSVRASSGIDRHRVHRVPIGRADPSERPNRRAIWRTAMPARPPKPTSATPAERLQGAVHVEYSDVSARLRVKLARRSWKRRMVQACLRWPSCALGELWVRSRCRKVGWAPKRKHPRSACLCRVVRPPSRTAAKLSPRYHGQAPRLARVKTCAENM